MENFKGAGMLVGRVLVGHIFLVSGVSKLLDVKGTMAYMSSHHMHAVGLWLALAIIVEIGAGAMLLAGWFTRLASLALIFFLVPVTFIFHWDPGNRLQMIMLMKNLAILGGLFLLLAEGPGRFSVDFLRSGKRG
ncbi:MAG: DoxX family protein [Deltaproteobacteria bacterium]|nr:MAG: DoxX family protein [Deltaproteobacteria bacterium]